MRRHLAALRTLALLGALAALACGHDDSAATRRRAAPTTVGAADTARIPRDLDEALVELDVLVPPEAVAKWKAMDEDSAVTAAHFGLGRYLRNRWGLWGGSPLRTYFWSLGVQHPDDMSSIILLAYHRRLRGQPVELQQLVRLVRERQPPVQAVELPSALRPLLGDTSRHAVRSDSAS